MASTSNKIYKAAEHVCQFLYKSELHAFIDYMLKILSGAITGYKFKDDTFISPNFRQYRNDYATPLTAPPPSKENSPSEDWKDLMAKHEQATGKKIHPVKRRDGKYHLSSQCRCSHCNAPSEYLYLNDGKVGNQVRCKICKQIGTSDRVRRVSNANYFCPFCHHPLYVAKKYKNETVYKCFNNKCSHYRENLAKLTSLERQKRLKQKHDPNYKLRYQFRLTHIDPNSLRCNRPDPAEDKLGRIHNSYELLGLILTFTINASLSLRQTKTLLKGLFGIKISHQTIANYLKASASHIAPFVDAHMPSPGDTVAADETYLKVENEWHYIWFVIDAKTKAISGYNLSNTRGTEPAIATLISAYGDPKNISDEPRTVVKDGLTSYNAAIQIYNTMAGKTVLEGKTVIGLENKDPESKKFRHEKNLVERLNRTYKFHTRPRAGMKSMDGAVALTTLFVAYYNHMRQHSRLDDVPVPLKKLKEIELFPQQWVTLMKMATAT